MDEIVEIIAKRMLVYWIGAVSDDRERDALYTDLTEIAEVIYKEIKPLILSQVRQELEKEFVELAHYKSWQAFWEKYGLSFLYQSRKGGFSLQ